MLICLQTGAGQNVNYLFWEQSSVLRGQKQHHPWLSFCCLSLKPCDSEGDLRTAGGYWRWCLLWCPLCRGHGSLCALGKLLSHRKAGHRPGAHRAKQKFTPKELGSDPNTCELLWINLWNYRWGSFLQCYWSGRTWRLCKCKLCCALRLFDFELIVRGWMLDVFCNAISIKVWKEASLPLLSNVSFINSADILGLEEKMEASSFQTSFYLRVTLWPSAQTFWWGLHAFHWDFYTGAADERHLGLYWGSL